LIERSSQINTQFQLDLAAAQTQHDALRAQLVAKEEELHAHYQTHYQVRRAFSRVFAA
jgi:hypothetical protein